ncbi:uncharacterized protein LOC111623673 [Centruroides sculpturatus]|uniref:uncharacterized protein LOC111623673 n=1 Tax=Centruroides sculpturatus TaxID=218467 RepID=UPI000C6EAFD1|nr:uncharacterized protein LOC111623673 [Centruroides sculpturatus]
MRILIILLCLVTSITSQNGNDIVDKLVSALKTNDYISKEIDPAHLGGYESDNFKATNIVVKGLINMNRMGNSSWKIDDSYESINLNANLMANDLKILLDYNFKLLLVPFSGIMRFNVEQIVAEIILSTNIRPIQPRLDLFSINDVQGLKIEEITGFKPLNWFAKFVMDRVVHRLIPRVKTVVNEKVTVIINDNLPLLTEVVKSVM